MTNEIKVQFAFLDSRISRIENMLNASMSAMSDQASAGTICAQCGTNNPHSFNYECIVENCCQGLNPDDDRE